MKKLKSYLSYAILAGIATQASISNADEVRQIDLVTNDLIYNPVDEKIYASIPGSQGANGNSIVTIDPVTGAIGSFVYVGSEPNELALSDNGEYLYIDLSGSASVVPYHIPTMTAQAPIVLGDDQFFGPLYAEDIEVQPGNPNVIAVSLKRLGVSPKHGGVAIFENGVKLPNATPNHSGSNVIEFGFDPNVLYGYNNESTGYGFRTMEIDETGVSILDSIKTAISGFNVDIEFEDGVVYSTSGDAIDPVTGNPLGSFANVNFADAIAVDSVRDKVYFLDNGEIQTFSKKTYIFEKAEFYGGTNTDNLVLWGESGLAYSTADQVILVSEETPTKLSLHPSSGKFISTQNFDFAAVVTGPNQVIDFSASVGNVDITNVLSNCILGGNELQQKTLRCAGFGNRLVQELGNGPHAVDMVIGLDNATKMEASVTWEFINTTE
ncbi:YncE family protein [Neptuniibacter sp. PT34_22]|uniref:YncE family protein n=1 Tax=Neptuniibacter sp. PT34_22 TaxID=3398205 RepID=UPI0039F5A5EF